MTKMGDASSMMCVSRADSQRTVENKLMAVSVQSQRNRIRSIADEMRMYDRNHDYQATFSV